MLLLLLLLASLKNLAFAAPLVFAVQTVQILAKLCVKYLKFELKFEINSSQ